MAIPTYSAASVGLYDPDNHRLAPGGDGLTLVISPLCTHDSRRDPEASEETNAEKQRAMVDRSRAQFLAQMQWTQYGYSYMVSQVARQEPERAVNIPGSGVWVVVMPAPEEPRRQVSSHGDDGWDRYDDDRMEEDYVVAVLDGQCHVDIVEDGAAMLRQAHRDTGRMHSLFGMRMRRFPGIVPRPVDPWNGRELVAGEAVPNHLPEAVAVIAEIYLLQQQPSVGGVSASLERAVAAVRAHGGESAALLERVLSR